MGRIFPRLQSVTYLFSKYFDVWKASAPHFVCLGNIFAALVKYHHLNTFRSGGKRGLGEQRSAPMQVGQKARSHATPVAQGKRWRRTIRRSPFTQCFRSVFSMVSAPPSKFSSMRHASSSMRASRSSNGMSAKGRRCTPENSVGGFRSYSCRTSGCALLLA